MGSTTRKFTAALGAVSSSPVIKASHPKWMTMKRETLYTVLEEHGYYWDADLQAWFIREHVEVRSRKGLKGIEDVVNSRAKTFLVRIMCPRNEADEIEAEWMDLARALGWEATRSGREYENEPAGQWVRRYYKVERKD